MNRKLLGNYAEKICSLYLTNRGYIILAKNYRQKCGEIDIIAKLGKTIIFVEVKSNKKDYGPEFAPEQRVNKQKLNKIIKTAMIYIGEMTEYEISWQIDVISITFKNTAKSCIVRHYKNVGESYS